MKIATLVFTYHRSEHTKRVLDGLAKNDILPEKLFVFQDGIKDTTNYDEWKKVNDIIKNIDWCDAEIHVFENNVGLSKRITSGIHYVFQRYDAIIVLEDDCVPEKQFMRFMINALNSYKNEEKVYSVSGYAWNIDLIRKGDMDAYFNGKCCSWGWGTWKEKWKEYKEDYRILTRIKNNPEAKNRLAIWGSNMESMLIGNITGKCDSWAVFWGLKIIEKGGYCLSPYRSLVHNIGFDGSGVHKTQLKTNNIVLEAEFKNSFLLPKIIKSSKECEQEFQFLFAKKQGEEKFKLYQNLLVKWIQMKQYGKKIQISNKCKGNVAVWGKGKILDCLLHEIQEQLVVKCIIESQPSEEEYKGIPIISIEELHNDIKSIIVIPYFDMEQISYKVKKRRNDIILIGIDELIDNIEK